MRLVRQEKMVGKIAELEIVMVSVVASQSPLELAHATASSIAIKNYSQLLSLMRGICNKEAWDEAGQEYRMTFAPSVIPGRASWREPGIHRTAHSAVKWIPGSRFARPE